MSTNYFIVFILDAIRTFFYSILSICFEYIIDTNIFNLLCTKRINLDVILMLMVRKGIYSHFFCKWDNLTEQKKAIEVSNIFFLLEKMRFEDKPGWKLLIIFFIQHTLMKCRFFLLSTKIFINRKSIHVVSVSQKTCRRGAAMDTSDLVLGKDWIVKYQMISQNN